MLCSPLGGAHSPCGEPAAEPEQEGSGDTERPRHDESESECERTSKRAWEQKMDSISVLELVEAKST